MCNKQVGAEVLSGNHLNIPGGTTRVFIPADLDQAKYAIPWVSYFLKAVLAATFRSARGYRVT